jgi:transcriptional regulator with XRE-family HTH domain
MKNAKNHYRGRPGAMELSTFGKRLRVLRIDRDLSQIELRDAMEKLGVSIGETYISELERTTKMPMLEVAAAMARVLNVSLDYLGLLVDDARSYKAEPVETYISPEAEELAQIADAMHVSQREILLTVAKNMASAPTPRQEERARATDVLDSVEREHGRAMREQIKELMRRNGFSVDPHA